jgi:hypothetical protein
MQLLVIYMGYYPKNENMKTKNDKRLRRMKNGDYTKQIETPNPASLQCHFTKKLSEG